MSPIVPPVAKYARCGYNTRIMAKRITGVGKNKTSRSKKTTKRLEAKKQMLEDKAKRRGNQ
jgi:hypothetical protein